MRSGAASRASRHGQSGLLGSAPARLLHLLRARLLAPCSSALPGWAPASGVPASASGARAASSVARGSPRVPLSLQALLIRHGCAEAVTVEEVHGVQQAGPPTMAIYILYILLQNERTMVSKKTCRCMYLGGV